MMVIDWLKDIMFEVFTYDHLILVTVTLGSIVYFFPRLLPKWTAGLEIPDEIAIEHEGIELNIIKTDRMLRLFKFKEDKEKIPLCKLLHSYFITTRYVDMKFERLFGFTFMVKLMNAYRRLILSNVTKDINSILIPDMDNIEVNIGIYNLRPEDVELRFKLPSFLYMAMLEHRKMKFILNKMEVWGNYMKEYQEVKMIDELLYRYGMIEVYVKGTLAHVEYNMFRIELIKTEKYRPNAR